MNFENQQQETISSLHYLDQTKIKASTTSHQSPKLNSYSKDTSSKASNSPQLLSSFSDYLQFTNSPITNTPSRCDTIKMSSSKFRFTSPKNYSDQNLFKNSEKLSSFGLQKRNLDHSVIKNDLNASQGSGSRQSNYLQMICRTSPMRQRNQEGSQGAGRFQQGCQSVERNQNQQDSSNQLPSIAKRGSNPHISCNSLNQNGASSPKRIFLRDSDDVQGGNCRSPKMQMRRISPFPTSQNFNKDNNNNFNKIISDQEHSSDGKTNIGQQQFQHRNQTSNFQQSEKKLINIQKVQQQTNDYQQQLKKDSSEKNSIQEQAYNFTLQEIQYKQKIQNLRSEIMNLTTQQNKEMEDLLQDSEKAQIQIQNYKQINKKLASQLMNAHEMLLLTTSQTKPEFQKFESDMQDLIEQNEMLAINPSQKQYSSADNSSSNASQNDINQLLNIIGLLFNKCKYESFNEINQQIQNLPLSNKIQYIKLKMQQEEEQQEYQQLQQLTREKNSSNGCLINNQNKQSSKVTEIKNLLQSAAVAKTNTQDNDSTPFEGINQISQSQIQTSSGTIDTSIGSENDMNSILQSKISNKMVLNLKLNNPKGNMLKLKNQQNSFRKSLVQEKQLHSNQSSLQSDLKELIEEEI